MSTKIKIKRKEMNLLEGPILKKMILYALPIFATLVLQQLFNTADMSVVGKFVSNKAYSAVGSTSTIIGLFVEFFTGFSVGANVVTAYFIGKKDDKKANDAVHTAILFSVICGFIIAIVGLCSARTILRWTLVPEELLDMASLYLRIYFIGMPFYMLYNFCAAIFRSRGETRIPFYALTIGGVLNVGLNLFFVLVFRWGVAGVAIATVASNALSSVILLVLLSKRTDMLKFNLKKLKLHGEHLGRIVKIGLPAGFLGSVFSISNLCVQSAVNSLGSDVIAASSAAGGVEIYVQYIGNSFAQTVTTFISQNHGAKNGARCRKVARIATGLCVVVTFLASLAVYAAGGTLLKIFIDDPTQIDIALTRMKFTLLFKCIQSVMDILVGCLQGYGFTFVPALISIFGVCGVRLVWIFTYFKAHASLENLMVIYPITWVIASLSHGLCYFFVVNKIRKQREKEETKTIESETSDFANEIN